MATQTSGASRWLTIDNKRLSFETEDENKALNITEYSTHTIRITNKAPDDLTLSIDGKVLETERYGNWTWSLKHYAGLYRIIATAPGQQPQSALVRVFPHKFTQARYERMKDDLSKNRHRSAISPGLTCNGES